VQNRPPSVEKATPCGYCGRKEHFFNMLCTRFKVLYRLYLRWLSTYYLFLLLLLLFYIIIKRINREREREKRCDLCFKMTIILVE